MITMHIPHIESTHYIVNEAAISKMKDGVMIICAARGGVIEESALLAGLESGKVAGAALDVFEKEPPGSDPMPMHPKVVVHRILAPKPKKRSYGQAMILFQK
jgi:D-3-phosphoglycerate dehydrogenase / 2-oxoglutarate reductase